MPDISARRIVNILWTCGHCAVVEQFGCYFPRVCLCHDCHPNSVHSEKHGCPVCDPGAEKRLTSFGPGCCPVEVSDMVGKENLRKLEEHFEANKPSVVGTKQAPKKPEHVSEPWRCSQCGELMYNTQWDGQPVPVAGAPQPHARMTCSLCTTLVETLVTRPYWAALDHREQVAKRQLGRDMNR